MSIYYKPIVIEGVLYETQWNHEHRIEKEARQLEKAKIRSRNRAPGRRQDLIDRGNGACEICRIAIPAILNIHHIYPVRLGGAASDRNLVAICPNYHSSVHYVSRSKHAGIAARKVRELIAGGYTPMQAELIRLIASHDAHVLEDGTIEPYTDPPEQPFVIIDAPGVDPEVRKMYEAAYDARERRIKQFKLNSPLERIKQQMSAEREAKQQPAQLSP
jgi:hypothetical protein